MVEETLAELRSQCAPFSESETLVFPESQKTPESLFLRKTPKRPVKHPEDECTHNLVLFQKLLETQTGTRVRKRKSYSPESPW